MATYTSKTLIPGQEPIGQNNDGSYIYEQNMSVDTTLPKTTKSTVPDMTNTSTGIKNVGVPRIEAIDYQKVIPGKEFTTQEKADIQQIIDKPKAINDSLKLSSRIDNNSERVKQLRQHFDHLKGQGKLQLNNEQSAYIKRFKEKFPDYTDVSDVILYGKVILGDPKTMDKYGNIGEKGILQSIVEAPYNIAKSGGEAINRSIDVYDKNIEEFGGTVGNNEPSAFDKIMAAIPAVAGGALNVPLAVAGELGNTATNIIPDTGSNNQYTTSFTEDISQGVSKTIEAAKPIVGAIPEAAADFIRQYIPQEWQKDFKDAVDRNPGILPKVQTMIEDGVDIANLLPFLKVKGPAWVDELASKKWVGEDIISTIKEKSKNMGPAMEAKYSAQNTTDWASPTQDVRRGNKTLDKIVAKQEAKKIDSPQTLTDLGIKHDEHIVDGKYDTKATADEIKNSAGELSKNTLRPVLEDIDTQSPRFVSLDKIRDDAIALAEKNKSKNTADIIEDIQKALDDARKGSLREQYPNGFTRIGLHDNKIEFSKGQYDAIRPTKTTAERFIADAMRKELEDIVPESIVPVKAFNRELEKMYAAARYMEELHAKTVAQSTAKRLLDKGARTIGTMVGGVIGGTPGAIAGYQTTSILQRMANNLSNPLKNYFLNKAETKVPGAISKVGEFQKGINISGQPGVPLLESPKFNARANELRSPSDTTLPGGERGYLGNNSSNTRNTANDMSKTDISPNNTPSIPHVNKTPVQQLAQAIEKGTTVDKSGKVIAFKTEEIMKKLDSMTDEEIMELAQTSPKARNYVEVKGILESVDETINGVDGYGVLPPNEVTTLAKTIKESGYSPELKKYMMEELPKEVKAEIYKQNRIKEFGEDFTEKKEITPEAKKNNEKKIRSKGKLIFLERFPNSQNVSGDELYKIAKTAVEDGIDDLDSFNPQPKLRSNTKASIKKYQKEMAEWEKNKNRNHPYAKAIETAAEDLNKNADDLFNEIKQLYDDVENGKANTMSVVDDNIDAYEAEMKRKFDYEAELKSQDEAAKTYQEPTQDNTPPEPTPQVEVKTEPTKTPKSESAKLATPQSKSSLPMGEKAIEPKKEGYVIYNQKNSMSSKDYYTGKNDAGSVAKETKVFTDKETAQNRLIDLKRQFPRGQWKIEKS